MKEKYKIYSPQEDTTDKSKAIQMNQIDIKINQSEVTRDSADFLSNYLKSIKNTHKRVSGLIKSMQDRTKEINS